MISIIICSRYSDISQVLRDNIKQTINTPYEIVCIDNSKGMFNMCSAYNEGVKRANGEYLCFMHEDIKYLSSNWGNVIEKEFLDSSVWMLGMMGTQYMDSMYCYWYPTPYLSGHVYKGNKCISFGSVGTSMDVVAVDGVWMVIRKEAFDDGIRWDNDTFTHFDMYDMDISMQILSKHKKIRVVQEIDIVHYSDGNFTQSFFEDDIKFHNKWDFMFPVASFEITDDVIKTANRFILNRLNAYEYIERSRLKKLNKWPLCLLYSLYQKIKK